MDETGWGRLQGARELGARELGTYPTSHATGPCARTSRADNIATLHHHPDAAKISNPLAGISFDRNQIGEQAGLDLAQPVVEVKDPGIDRGRRLEDLQGRHPVLDHQL